VCLLKTALGLVAGKMRGRENLSSGFSGTNAPSPNTSDDPLKDDGPREKGVEVVVPGSETNKMSPAEKMDQDEREEERTIGREILRTIEEQEKGGMNGLHGRVKTKEKMLDPEKKKENVPLPQTRNPLGRGLH
jgi:hypothetical protein